MAAADDTTPPGLSPPQQPTPRASNTIADNQVDAATGIEAATRAEAVTGVGAATEAEATAEVEAVGTVNETGGAGGMADGYAALLAADSSLPDDLDDFDGLDGLDDLVGPTFWPSIPAADIAVEWVELRDWVERLVRRFPHLDHHAIPACWYRHNGHVEALAALRDHEKVSYADSSPATSPAQWHQVFALIESRLREWTAQAGCMSAHREPQLWLRPVDSDEWDRWVAHDNQRRLDCWDGTQPAR